MHRSRGSLSGGTAARFALALLAAAALAAGVDAGTNSDAWEDADAAGQVPSSADIIARTCPPRTWVDAVNRQFPAGITFDHDPSVLAPGGCPGDPQHDPLTRLQAKAYQSLHLMRRHLVFDAPLPWTSASLWDWFRQSVLGIVFTDEPHSWCCDPSGRIHVAVDATSVLLAPWGDTFIDPESRRHGLHEFIGLLVHEARHANGVSHGCADGTGDQTIGEMGAWAAERFLFAWWADHSIAPAFWRPDDENLAPARYLDVFRREGEALCRVGARFCDDECVPRPYLPAGDYDGDGRADPSVYRYWNRTWYMNRTALGTASQRWGRLGDVPVSADYDGDGRTDLAVYRAPGSLWLILASAGGRTEEAWGSLGDRPVPADYDGDGRADLAVWRPSDGSWRIRLSVDGAEVVLGWGAHEWDAWIPVPADYDGDGRADPAAFHPPTGTWRIAGSRGVILTRNLGAIGDVPVPADYDGDGKADIAVWRPTSGTWHLARSSLGPEVVRLGQAGDVPVAGRFDVDLAADMAIFRPSTGAWMIRNSAGSPATTTFKWGRAGDVPQ